MEETEEVTAGVKFLNRCKSMKCKETSEDWPEIRTEKCFYFKRQKGNECRNRNLQAIELGNLVFQSCEQKTQAAPHGKERSTDREKRDGERDIFGFPAPRFLILVCS